MTAPAWRPEDLGLVFMTCPREPSYFPGTLASALLGDSLTTRLREIAVAVDAPDLDCVELLRHHERVRWIPRTEEENARVAPMHVHWRASHNYWRALGLIQAEVRAVLVCEDDLIFRDGWLAQLLQSLNEMRAHELQHFILAAYSPRDHEEPPFRRGRYYSSYVAHGFYGTQAMLYPAAEIAPLRTLLLVHGVETSEEPYDLLVRRRFIEQQHLYTTRFSLMQHIGAQSTGLGDGRHRSPSFATPWPVEAP